MALFFRGINEDYNEKKTKNRKGKDNYAKDVIWSKP